MADFADIEAADGVRMPWNIWPNSRAEMARCVVPVAAIVTPLNSGDPEVLQLDYKPIRCKGCSSILNPYCKVDYERKQWTCPFDFNRNAFPPEYMRITENEVPGEVFQSTVEYTVDSNLPISPPVFLFVLDTCLIEEEIGYLKSALLQARELMPENALIGLITFGTNVFVHELGHDTTPKSYCFKGSKEGVTKEQILEQLGLARRPPGAAPYQGVIAGVRDGLTQSNINRFLIPVSECEFTLADILDDLQRDSYPSSDTRPSRCTGTALTVAAGLLCACVPGTGARIMSFLGGPCTEGPGMIVGKDMSEHIRHHQDITKDSAPYYHQAIKFYGEMANQLVTQGHVLDFFACCLDQVGLAEMKVAVEKTGGLVVMAESFGHNVFKDSFKKLFEAGNSLDLSFNGIFEISASPEVRVQGIIGPCSSMEKSGPAVSETVIGQGNTTAWSMSGLDRHTSLTVFFDLSKTANPPANIFLQFSTRYQRSDGHTRLRITTVMRGMADGATDTESLLNGFDQDAAAVVTAKLLCYKVENEEGLDASRWLDRSLIKMCSRFGDYQQDVPESFTLNPRISLFPQFMFHLRRSQFVQVFGNSPDETAQFRMALNREKVSNSLVMIQPTLVSYAVGAAPEPIMLDIAALISDRILLLDAFFCVVICHGTTVAQWRSAGYHLQEEFKHLAEFLEAPRLDAQPIMQDRFPVPRLVICDQHKSQARFLLAKLNPSATYNTATGPPPGGDIIFTDDVSYQVFIEHLQRLAVASQT